MDLKRTLVGMIILNGLALICLICAAVMLVNSTKAVDQRWQTSIHRDREQMSTKVALDCSRPEGKKIWVSDVIGLRGDNRFAISEDNGTTTIVEVKDSWVCVIGKNYEHKITH